jgi:oligogalacturonide lyase
MPAEVFAAGVEMALTTCVPDANPDPFSATTSHVNTGKMFAMRGIQPGLVLASLICLHCGLALPAAGADDGAPASRPATKPAAVPPAPDEWLDPATGHRVTRLSRLPGTSTGLYFHQNVFTADGHKMVFLNTPPGGRSRLCAFDFKTRQVEVVTEAPAGGGGFGGLVVGGKGREAFYRAGQVIYATHLDTKQTRKLGELPAGWARGAGFAINADETLLAGSFAEGRADVPPGTPKGAMMERVFAARLPNSLYTFRIDNGESKVLHKIDTWLGHVQFSPTDPGLLMFCHEGPWHKLDRIWTIRVDGTAAAAPKLMHERGQPMEIAGHEFWDRSGEAVWFDLQTPKGEKFFLASNDLEGKPRARYELTRDQWSIHFAQSHDHAHFAGDGGDPKQVARAPDGKWIWLFTPRADAKALDAERLCTMADHNYSLEPNVRFSPDDRWVIFHANLHGSSQVYAVEVARAKP